MINNLKKNREKWIKAFSKTKKNVALKKHSMLFDEYFLQTFESFLSKKFPPFAIIAIGGYGREEQCGASDVDLLFLFENSVPKNADIIVSKFIYPLWDIKMEVGYAFRSLKENIKEAKKNIESLTALLDARFICGFSDLYSKMQISFEKNVLSNKKKIAQKIYTLNDKRHRRFGDSANLLEPNLKNGQGGLRDYHTMLWLAKILFFAKTKKDLEILGILSPKDYENFNKSLNFIWNIRNRLQILTKKKNDTLYFEYQTMIAEELNIKSKTLVTSVENFLSSLHMNMEFIKEQYLTFTTNLDLFNTKIFKRKKYKTNTKGIEIRNDRLEFEKSKIIPKNPMLLLKIFAESAKQKKTLGAESKRLVTEFIKFVPKLYNDKDAVKLFENILMKEDANIQVLSSMLSSKILFSFIPEFKEIASKIQYNHYHIFPVDKHSIKTFAIIKSFGEKTFKDKMSYAKIYKKIAKKNTLFWAALLHDIGKGFSNTNHADKGAKIASKLFLKMGFNQKKIKDICFLIENHLFLIKAATRRDVFDLETISIVATKTKNIQNLSMLYLLSVADAMATGPKAWNSWTRELLHILFLRVNDFFGDSDFSSKTTFSSIDKKKEILLLDYDEKLIEKMSIRYLLTTKTNAIKNHIKLFENLKKNSFIWDIKKKNKRRNIVFCAKNQKGLLAKISSIFALNNINILDATINTWTNDTAMNIFTVSAPKDTMHEDEKWEKIKQDLNKILINGENFSKKIKKISRAEALKIKGVLKKNLRVKIDNKGSSFFSIINVVAYDIKGLLAFLVTSINKEELDIKFAIISGKIDQVVDSFYVTNKNGEKIKDIKKIKISLQNKLENMFLRGKK